MLAQHVVRLTCLLLACVPLKLIAATLNLATATTAMSAPIYVADKQGFFAAEGLTVVIQDCSSGAACMKLMLDGKAQMATAAELPVMFSSFERRDFVILASFCGANADTKLIVRKSANIASFHDLAGKRIAVPFGTSSQYAFELLALSQGLDPRSMTVVNMSQNDIVQAMADHKVDAAAIFEPIAYKLMQYLAADGQRLATDTPYSLSFNLLSMKVGAEKQAEDMSKVLHALNRAVQYIQENPASAESTVLDHLKLEQGFITWSWSDLRFNLILSQSLLTTLESEARWAIRENLVRGQSIPNFLDVVDPTLLRKVRPGGITLVK